MAVVVVVSIVGDCYKEVVLTFCNGGVLVE